MADLPEKPITREEKFYAAALGQISVDELPAPITRKEIYLYNLALSGGGGGEGGTTNYNALTNKPSIEGTTIQGVMVASDLNLATEDRVDYIDERVDALETVTRALESEINDVSSDLFSLIWEGTQEEYEALTPTQKKATLYVIPEEEEEEISPQSFSPAEIMEFEPVFDTFDTEPIEEAEKAVIDSANNDSE